MTPDLAEQVKLIAKVRAFTTNKDMLAVCEIASRVLFLVVSTPAPEPEPVVSTCPACAKRRAAKTARMKKWRKGKAA